MLVYHGEDDDGNSRDQSPHEEAYLSPFPLSFGRWAVRWLAGEKSVFFLDVVGRRVGRGRTGENRLVAGHHSRRYLEIYGELSIPDGCGVVVVVELVVLTPS